MRVGRRGAAAVALMAALATAGCGVRPVTPPARADAAVQTLDAHFYRGGRWVSTVDFWQNAQAFGVLLDAYQRTHSAAFAAMIPQVYAENRQHGRIGDYTSTSIDDEGWWGLDWTRAWDLTGDAAYLQTSKAVFANMAATWDDTCGGGVWWKSSPKQYKNAITNELFLLLAVELHERTAGDRGPGSYLDWAQREANWFLASGMINGRGLVSDGLDNLCRNNGGTTWTYNQGVILAGLAELSRDTGQASYLRTAERIADAATTALVPPGGVLREPCEPARNCGADGEEFKGIFIRYLWWLYTVDHKPAYRAFLAHTQDVLWTAGRSPTGDFGVSWSVPPSSTAQIDAETDTAAAAALTSTALPLAEKPRKGPGA